ncbi:unnamed protein product [Enterobius vermicularis]|uniref:Secreted protein n=1 Tax=Enterobius vermicularis TaxID=51028 RepID=A0A0N4VQ38_ENTVE|nr:unnamed protein product [Enterobius vermicularis]
MAFFFFPFYTQLKLNLVIRLKITLDNDVGDEDDDGGDDDGTAPNSGVRITRPQALLLQPYSALNVQDSSKFSRLSGYLYCLCCLQTLPISAFVGQQ